MTTRRELDRLERALAPRAAVLHWFETASREPSVDAYARARIAAPEARGHMGVIHDQVVAAVRAGLAGASDFERERATDIALRDALFLYQLVLVLNDSLQPFAQLSMLGSLVLVAQMGPLMAEPCSTDPAARRADPAEARDVDARWRSWRAAIEVLVDAVRVEERARTYLDDRFFGGQPVMFTESAEAWTEVRDRAERLALILDRLPEPYRTRAGLHRRRGSDANAGAPGDRAWERARELITDARIAGLDWLGERRAARELVELRLTWAQPKPTSTDASAADRVTASGEVESPELGAPA